MMQNKCNFCLTQILKSQFKIKSQCFGSRKASVSPYVCKIYASIIMRVTTVTNRKLLKKNYYLFVSSAEFLVLA